MPPAVALQFSAYAVTYLCQEFCVRAADRATHEPVQLMAPLVWAWPASLHMCTKM